MGCCVFSSCGVYCKRKESQSMAPNLRTLVSLDVWEWAPTGLLDNPEVQARSLIERWNTQKGEKPGQTGNETMRKIELSSWCIWDCRTQRRVPHGSQAQNLQMKSLQVLKRLPSPLVLMSRHVISRWKWKGIRRAERGTSQWPPRWVLLLCFMTQIWKYFQYNKQDFMSL